MNECAENQQQSALQRQLRVLVDQHHKNLIREIDAARPLFLAIGAVKPADCQAFQRSIAISHKIAGSSGSMGFSDISQTAKKIENHLKSLAAIDGYIPVGDCDLVQQYFCDLEAQIASVTPEDSELFFAEEL